MDLADQAAGIGALAEPARRALYEYVASQPDAVGREQAAEALGVPVHVAKFHLERLVDEGLLETEFRRLSGRSGPGAGRPSKLYRRSAAQWSVSLPERHYDLVGQILAAGVERATREQVPVDVAIDESARARGRDVGTASTETPAPDRDDWGRLSAALGDVGYEPRVEDDVLLLQNCPFDALAKDHTRLVCGLNRHFVQGVIEGLGCPQLEACLEPEAGMCCVRTRRRD